jgi:hypothetical protein
VHNAFLRVGKGLLDVEVYSIKQRALLDDEIVQFFVYVGQLADRFHQFCDLLCPLRLFTCLGLVDLKIELVFHLFYVLLPEFDCHVDCACFVHFEPIEVLLFLSSQGFADLSYFHR